MTKHHSDGVTCGSFTVALWATAENDATSERAQLYAGGRDATYGDWHEPFIGVLVLARLFA